MGITPGNTGLEASFLADFLARMLRRNMRRQGSATVRAALVQYAAMQSTAGRAAWAGSDVAARRFEDWPNATNVLFDLASAAHAEMIHLCLFCQAILDRT